MANPTKYTPEVAQKIYERAAAGETLARIGAGKAMPSKQTIQAWLRDNEEFQKGYFRAKRAWAAAKAEELEELGQSAIDAARGEDVDPKRLNALVCAINNQAANLRWLISRMYPERYGDKVQAEISGKDGGAIEAAITVQFVKSGQDGGTAGSC